MTALIIVSTLLVVVLGFLVFAFCSCKGKQEDRDKESLYSLVQNGSAVSLNIDGKIGETEWSGYEWCSLGEGQNTATVYLTNDNQYLYLAVKEQRNTFNDTYNERATLCFIPNETLKIQDGKFKILKIFGNGMTVWENWTGLEKLDGVAHVRRTEEYADALKARVGKDEAVRVYDGDRVWQGEDAVYAIFAKNIKQLPEGLAAKTDFGSYRTYEARIPLSVLGVSPGQTMRVFGSIYDNSSESKDWHYPNTWTKFFTNSPYTVEKISAD